MLPIADLGRGSAAGGLCYLETNFPAAYRGNLLFAEWGRSVVRYGLRRSGSGFGETAEMEFTAAAETDPYGFRPTSLVVDYDGSVLVADWGDGQRPKRGRGRVYRFRYDGNRATEAPVSVDDSVSAWVSRLDAPSYHARIAAQRVLESRGDAAFRELRARIQRGGLGVLGQLHAVWVFARVRGQDAIDDLLRLASPTQSARIRVQAIRAVADLADPVFVKRRLDAGRGDAALAERLAGMAKDAEAAVVREIVLPLGRWRWSEIPG